MSIAVRLCRVDQAVIEQAIDIELRDFEHGVQLACARLNQLDAIVTRDRRDFTGATLPIWLIADLVLQLS